MTTTSLGQQRVDLACALRWAARLGSHEGVCNHFSLAVADEDGRIISEAIGESLVTQSSTSAFLKLENCPPPNSRSTSALLRSDSAA